MTRRYIITMIFQLIVTCLSAQTPLDTAFRVTQVTHAQFLSMVRSSNLSYAAEKFNIQLAQAAIEAAKVFPDPSLTFNWVDNGQKRMKMGYGFNSSVNWLLELGGKRKARGELASSQLKLTGFLVDDFFRNLRADGTIVYLQVLLQQDILKVTKGSYESMLQLARADSIRYKLGEIKEIDARQSKLEAAAFLNDVYKAEANWKAALVTLQTFMGKHSDTLYSPKNNIVMPEKDFSLHDLLNVAAQNRSDIMAALKNKDVAGNMLRLAKADRMIDLGLNMGLANNAAVLNQVSPTPSTSVVSAGITIPLKFSSKYRAELLTAQYSIQQADLRYRQAEVQVKAEVTAAYYNYVSAKQQVQHYRSGLLEDAQKTLDGKIYSYVAGETNLLDVLNARRTYNTLIQGYHESLNNLGVTLVELERAAGIWDIYL
ncbi:MAG: TolC family protein [Chitinophagaceae bacterium]|nr:TolC family protein [Chitinophagaceae bacterium]